MQQPGAGPQRPAVAGRLAHDTETHVRHALASRWALVDGDGVVTDADYTIWADTYLSTTDLRADFNGDGAVTDADYTIWADNYTGSGAVPEPATLGLLLLSGLVLLKRKRST